MSLETSAKVAKFPNALPSQTPTRHPPQQRHTSSPQTNIYDIHGAQPNVLRKRSRCTNSTNFQATVYLTSRSCGGASRTPPFKQPVLRVSMLTCFTHLLLNLSHRWPLAISWL